MLGRLGDGPRPRLCGWWRSGWWRWVDVGVLSLREGHGVVDWRCLLVTRASKQVQCLKEGCCNVWRPVAFRNVGGQVGQVMLWAEC